MLRNPYFLLLYMALGSVIPLGVALFAQFAMKLAPCDFCIYQRYPYALVLFFLVFTIPGVFYPQWIRLQALGAAVAWLITSGLGFYHFGIEQGWVSYQGECVGAAPVSSELADLKAQIAAAPLVSCADVGWEFLGISMPFWNGVAGLALALGMFYMLRLQWRDDAARRS